MPNNVAQSVDSSMFISNSIGRILVTSLLTAIILRLANRISIRANINYKTAYVSSLLTNTIILGIGVLIGLLYIQLGLNTTFAFIPLILLSIPINAVVYQRMISDNNGSSIRFKSAIILSSTLIGIVISISLLLVGSIFAFGLLAK